MSVFFSSRRRQTICALVTGVQTCALPISTPLEQFTLWFDEALKAGVAEPNAMTLATATPDGRPSARIVLLKGIDEQGLVFYTNYSSRKGNELDRKSVV